MNTIYKDILRSISRSEKLLAVLVDPDKMEVEYVSTFMTKVNQSIATHVFVGGSEVKEGQTEALVTEIKNHTKLPVLLFPGDIIQITDKADGILFLSLISGRNPEYLIGKHVASISRLKKTKLEVIPTGYVLVASGNKTSVELVSQTKPIKQEDIQVILDTVIAGEFLGMKLIYLEAGSGATHTVEPEIIQNVKEEIGIPLIVGGGIRSKAQMSSAYNAGADIVVIGTAFEEDESFFNEIKIGR